MEKISSGIKGLDEILKGGFIKGRAYLITGGPGTGKTTLCLHFLQEGISKGERSLFITLTEKEEQIIKNATRVGINVDGIDFLDLSPDPEFFVKAKTYDIFHSSEVEREPIITKIISKIEELQPKRVVIDSMTQFRYLTQDVYQFRKEVLSFLRFITDKNGTVLFISEGTKEMPDDDLRYISDGIIELSLRGEERILCVKKFRGSDFFSGDHSYEIIRGSGFVVYPSVRVPEKYAKVDFGLISSGTPEIDELLKGGIERGTITVISGPSGVGKTTLGMQFIKEAAGRGERSVVYTFDETPEQLIYRCENVNIAARHMIEKGTLEIKKIEPLIYSPDAFAQMVREDINIHNTEIVMIDSSSGYQRFIKGKDLLSHLHAICKYLTAKGVTVFLPSEVKNITGEFIISSHDVSYLADNVIFLRYLEIKGELRRTIGVLKKRLGDFEKTLREFQITRYGIKVGEPLINLKNILTGIPVLIEER